MARDVVTRIWALAEPVAQAQGCELVDIEHGGGRKRQIIRLFIDKDGGVDLSDCERVSRELGRQLEEEDAVGGPYVLEVSSPGMERPLRREADFRRYAGRRIRLVLRGDEDAGRRKVVGTLRGIEAGEVALETPEGERRSFPLDAIAKANLDVDWNAEFRAHGKPGGAFSGRAHEGGMTR